MLEHEQYELPKEFYDHIKPYLEAMALTQAELIRVLKHAIEMREQHPEMQDSIAEWTMSTGAYTTGLEDGGELDDIRCSFGALEDATYLTPADSPNWKAYNLGLDSDWAELAERVHQL